MATNTRISVVIPTYENRELTLRCLAALWLCSPQPDEVIIVDNGSSDNTAHSVLRKYPRHIMVRLPSKQSYSSAANHGLARASGDLLLLLDNKTEVDPSSIGAILEAFSENDRLGVAGANLRHPNGRQQWSGGRLPGSLWCFALASGFASILDSTKVWRWLRSPSGLRKGRVDWVAGTAMVVRKTLWEKIGPFDLAYRFRGKYLDHCFRAADAGWKIKIIPGFGVVYPLTELTPSNDGSSSFSEDELLWTDLLRFANKRNGETGARQSSRALRVGGRLRLLGRRMATPLVPRDHKEEWRAETVAYAQALRSIGEPMSDGQLQKNA